MVPSMAMRNSVSASPVPARVTVFVLTPRAKTNSSTVGGITVGDISVAAVTVGVTTGAVATVVVSVSSTVGAAVGVGTATTKACIGTSTVITWPSVKTACSPSAY